MREIHKAEKEQIHQVLTKEQIEILKEKRAKMKKNTQKYDGKNWEEKKRQHQEQNK
jgi:hypothetical protein